MSNAHYWKNKEDRAQKAREHTEDVSKKYASEIDMCTKSSIVIREIDSTVGAGTPEFIVTDRDTVSEIFAQEYMSAVALNFASYKDAGGGFLKGSSAQEESLCMESYLYNVLINFQSFYDYNKKHLNRGLYTNAAIYSPSVRFMRGKELKLCDVLTCAAPNNSISKLYGGFTAEDNSGALKDRVIFVRDIIESANVDTAILGAWGCGVFQQDPVEVATLFKEAFSKSDLHKIVFAVPGSAYSRENYLAFKKVFS